MLFFCMYFLNVILLNVILLNVILLNVIPLNVILLNVILLIVILLNASYVLNVLLFDVILLNIILFSIWAPKTTSSYVLVIKLFYFFSHPVVNSVSVKPFKPSPIFAANTAAYLSLPACSLERIGSLHNPQISD